MIIKRYLLNLFFLFLFSSSFNLLGQDFSKFDPIFISGVEVELNEGYLRRIIQIFDFERLQADIHDDGKELPDHFHLDYLTSTTAIHDLPLEIKTQFINTLGLQDIESLSDFDLYTLNHLWNQSVSLENKKKIVHWEHLDLFKKTEIAIYHFTNRLQLKPGVPAFLHKFNWFKTVAEIEGRPQRVLEFRHNEPTSPKEVIQDLELFCKFAGIEIQVFTPSLNPGNLMNDKIVAVHIHASYKNTPPFDRNLRKILTLFNYNLFLRKVAAGWIEDLAYDTQYSFSTDLNIKGLFKIIDDNHAEFRHFFVSLKEEFYEYLTLLDMPFEQAENILNKKIKDLLTSKNNEVINRIVINHVFNIVPFWDQYLTQEQKNSVIPRLEDILKFDKGDIRNQLVAYILLNKVGIGSKSPLIDSFDVESLLHQIKENEPKKSFWVLKLFLQTNIFLDLNPDPAKMLIHWMESLLNHSDPLVRKGALLFMIYFDYQFHSVFKAVNLLTMYPNNLEHYLFYEISKLEIFKKSPRLQSYYPEFILKHLLSASDIDHLTYELLYSLLENIPENSDVQHLLVREISLNDYLNNGDLIAALPPISLIIPAIPQLKEALIRLFEDKLNESHHSAILVKLLEFFPHDFEIVQRLVTHLKEKKYPNLETKMISYITNFISYYSQHQDTYVHLSAIIQLLQAKHYFSPEITHRLVKLLDIEISEELKKQILEYSLNLKNFLTSDELARVKAKKGNSSLPVKNKFVLLVKELSAICGLDD